MKKFLLFVLLFIGMPSTIFAHDCAIFPNVSLKKFDNSLYISSIKVSPVFQIIGKEGLLRAFTNLKSHCCNANILNDNKKMLELCKEDEMWIKDRTNYPESEYLIDHLVDVLIRKHSLDGVYSDVPIDEKAMKWKSVVEKVANSSEGTIPPVLGEKYKEFWKLQSEYLLPKYNGVSSESYLRVIDEKEKNQQVLSKYSDWNLHTKYRNLCQIAIYINMKLPVSLNADELLLFQNSCSDMISNIIDADTQMVSELITHKSDLLLKQNMDQYSNSYLMGARKFKLIEMFTRISSNLKGVVRMIPILVSICS